MTPEWLQLLSDWLAANPVWLSLALFLVAFVESLAIAGIIVPGVAIIFAVAALAAQAGMPLAEALLWAGFGAVCGDVASFGLGRLFQERLHRIWPFSRYPSILAKGERFFNLHGGKSVVIGRFVGPIRPVIPLVAGALLMPWRRFLMFNLISAVGWAPVYVLPGFLVGSALASDIRLPPHFYLILAISIGTITSVYLLLFRVQLGLSNNSLIYRLLAERMARYNTAHHFWRLYCSERPATSGEFPLPSLMLGVGATALFAVWAILATATDLLSPADTLTNEWFTILRHSALDPPMLFLSFLGDPPVLVSGALLAAAVLCFRGYYAAAVHVIAALLLTVATVWIGKYGFGVGRPAVVSLPPDSGAFPSGHAAGATVLAGLTASFVARERPRSRRWPVYLMFSLPMLLVGLSRLYLGVHWMSDVVGGLLLGLAVCGFIRASYSRHDQTPLSLDLLSVSALILWAAISGYYIGSSWQTAVMLYSPAAP